MSPSLVSVAALAAVCHPFQAEPWLGGRVSEALVRRCWRERRFQARPVMMDASPYRHAGRIAYLAENGWADPIEIDVGVPELGCVVEWPIQDGNHRLAAALVRGDETIPCVISGSLSHAATLLGVSI